MLIIDNTTVVVYSYDELKSALEGTYTYVYLGSNITMTNGIKINRLTKEVIINGTYEGVTYSLEDKKSLSASDTITISSNVTTKITVCNVRFIGYNYYGIIYIPDSNTYKDTTIEYKNIVYTGPQIAFNPYGLTRFIDCIVTIDDNTLVTGNEVAECNRIEIGGNTTITHNSKGNSAFWFKNSTPYLNILENANVVFNSPNRELFYGVTNLELNILNNASFNVTTHNGMAYGNFGTGATNLYPNSSLIIKQTTQNGSYSTWYSYGKINIDTNASLRIINDFPNISTSNYNINFSSSGSLTLNNPKEVVLYNSKANIINTSGTLPFSFTFNRLNLFTSSITINDNITKDTLPTYSWYKSSDLITITGTFNSTTATILTSTLTEEDLQTLPSLSNFVFANKKTLSIGDFAFRASSITDEDTTLSGLTLPNASVLITINDTSNVVLADDTGKFTYNLDSALPIGTNITFNVKKYQDLIYHTKIVQIVYSGDLTLDSATNMVEFLLTPISLNPIICPKKDDVNLIVTDTRINKTPWNIYASITKDFESLKGNILDASIIYVDDDNNQIKLTEIPQKIYTYTPSDDDLQITITFIKDKHLLLLLNSKVINNNTYQTGIIWSIEAN